MDSAAKSRDPSMDVIRCFALFCVVSVHFFLNSGFYDEPVLGKTMFAMVLVRNFFVISVPLFVLLSGYLMKNKVIEKSYFLKIGRTLAIYLLASLVCLAYRILVLGESYTLGQVIRGILSYTMCDYAWYIEMYIGLFFMIPFLNVLYNHLADKKQKRLLILVMVCTTSLPAWLNAYSVGQLLPQWWRNFYPVTYYFTGCYLREYMPKIPKWKNLLAIGAVFLCTGWFNYRKSEGATFGWGSWQYYYSVFLLAQAVLVFIFLANRDYSRLGDGARKFIGQISKWSLGAYLVSWVFDHQFYPVLIANLAQMKYRMLCFPLVVGGVVVCSLAVSAVLNLIYDGVVRLFSRKRRSVC